MSSAVTPQGTSLVARLRALAETDPAAPAVTCDSETLSRGELEDRADALARELRRLGVVWGDYVTVVLPNSVSHPVATLAAWKLGAIPQLISPKLADSEMREIITLARPSAVVGTTKPEVVGAVPALHADFVAPIVSSKEPPLPDVVSPAWKAPTSGGSTGRPKLIRAGQPALADAVGMWGALVRFPAGGTALITSPLSHNAGFMSLAGTLIAGGHAVMMPRFDAESFLVLIDRYKPCWTIVVPTMMTRILRLPADVRSRYDISSIQTVFHGAAPCSPEVKEEWIKWLGPEKILEAYSATEGNGVTLIDGTEWLAHRGSVGRPLLGEFQIRDDAGQALPSGQIGRVWVRRPEGMAPTYEYVGAEPTTDVDGWETVGDMGRFDEDGYLYLADRDSDMLLVGGSNVYPAEIEAAILEHPSVLDTCVVGLPDEDLGTVPLAVVYTEELLDLDDLERHVASRLAAYKRPRRYELVGEPIRDDAGKVRRAVLR